MTTEPTSFVQSNGSADQLHNSPSSGTTSEQLTEIIPIEETPFTAVRVQDKYFLALGKYRLTELLDTYEEIREQTETITWTMLLAVMTIIAREETEEAKEQLSRRIKALTMHQDSDVELTPSDN